MREAKPNPLDNKPDCLQIVVYRLALFEDRWSGLCPFGESQQSIKVIMHFSWFQVIKLSFQVENRI
ncbi:hypothetical protein [Bartonella sp. CM120XJJH]|uniref:hypothetical protein n=1 Tax=Bartonella sp. CM120XJJH TaxID=3243544 RepID=UPI0035CECA1E